VEAQIQPRRWDAAVTTSIRAINTHEWLPGEYFLLRRADAVMASTVVRST
jgi:hypothetical protein